MDAKLQGYTAEAEKKLEKGLNEARKEVNQAADKFDKTVIEVCCSSFLRGWCVKMVWLVARSGVG